MLTIRKIRVASGDWAAARRAATYILDVESSPAALDGGRAEPGRPSAIWLGSPAMLERLGVEGRVAIEAQQLGRVLQGRHATNGTRVRTEGLIQRDVLGDDGKPTYDAKGRRRTTRVRGTKCVDLTFSAPKSVSVMWSQAERDLRALIEVAMLDAAGAMLRVMTECKPVVPYRRVLTPARGFAAAAALHVISRTARNESVPSPQLHVHGVVVGVEREDGFFASPELSGMFKRGAPLEGGAVARARLAEAVVDMGFDVVRGDRYFEIRGVPDGLVKRMSGRTRDVQRRLAEREAAKGKPLSQRERAVAALETRMPKSKEASLSNAMKEWQSHATEFRFDAEAVARLQTGDGFAGAASRRRAKVRSTLGDRSAAEGSPGARRARVLECSAGVLRFDEAWNLTEQLEPRPAATSSDGS